MYNHRFNIDHDKMFNLWYLQEHDTSYITKNSLTEIRNINFDSQMDVPRILVLDLV